MVRRYNDNVHNKTMTLTGQGQVTAVPDIAVIRLGVQTTGENITGIQTDNARMTQSIIQALQRMGVNNIKTYQYTIDKLYDYENGRQIDRGFSVRNILEIRTNNLDMAGSIIDTAVNLGANVVELISFDVSNREYYYQQALNAAIRDAIQKSKSIAMSLNSSSEPIPVNIVENSIMPIQPFRYEFAASTPIMPGNMLVEANVTVDFEY
ncbi:SIMPL domain-containing protein [Sedimentibacter hydroxybenzoicus DSM 7310]|uniref:SIMPL domain-containing protein n=1 Tax=Sedimentibacter hydroxybenzoicus DSM 7310 TaxID=1123245 RepID=A0A974GV64_SEDHY|nr:SIMPL domain-containing protein [Sedimentibacter hydroxybenzoicus]NYB72984.1 SIMPL domain-containing protein [Sedimentibacter hydroxybenzoicus DSM 7310]